MKIDWIVEGISQQPDGRLTSSLASNRYRVIAPAAGLRELGHEVRFLSIADANAATADPPDALIVGKLLPGNDHAAYRAASERVLGVASQLRSQGVAVLADFNDDHFDHPVVGPHWRGLASVVSASVVGSEAKAKLAKRNGCRHALVRGRDPVAESVRKISKGGAHVVYDGVGKDTFTESLDSLRRRGLMVSYGSASGPVPPFSTAELVKRGSLYITRPTLFDYTAERKDLDSMARETFAALKKKWIRVRIHQRYPLAEAARAHRDLESRKTTGASVIIP